MSLSIGYSTDKGLVRRTNQDRYAVYDTAQLDRRVDGLAIVADGMGGRAGGEIASKLTVENFPSVVYRVLTEKDGAPSDESMEEALREAMRECNRAVYEKAQDDSALRGMGTTCVAALIRNGRAAIAHVGDSRAYLLRNGQFRQITQDHSLVQEHVRAGDLSRSEAQASRYRNVITRAIGVGGSVEPEIQLFDMEDGDTLLLCTDGLTNMVKDQEIAETLASLPNVSAVCDRLVAAANTYGGQDNITAVVVRKGPYIPCETIAVEHADDPQLETDEEEEDLLDYRSYSQAVRPDSARSHSGIWPWAAVVFALTAILLGAILYQITRTGFAVTSHWPFLEQSPIKTTVSALPLVNLANLEYGPPKVISSKPLRGSLLVCDGAGNVTAVTQAGKIQRITPAGVMSGDFGAPVGDESLETTRHWTADQQGNLYVSLTASKAIYKYNPAGTRIAVIGDGKLEGPQALAVDAKGNVYVIDKHVLKLLPARIAEPLSRPQIGGGKPNTLSVEGNNAPR